MIWYELATLAATDIIFLFGVMTVMLIAHVTIVQQNSLYFETAGKGSCSLISPYTRTGTSSYIAHSKLKLSAVRQLQQVIYMYR